MPNLWVIFTTGILAGGVSCAAVQGGLLATLIAGMPGNSRRQPLMPTLSFLAAKLLAHLVLGAALGLAGTAFTLSTPLQAAMLATVTIFMTGTALGMLDVHPAFRYFMIRPPRFLARMVRRQAQSHRVFAPAVLGLFTVFIPCGTTQAMMAVALSTRSPVGGAAVLGMFVLGTFPVFVLLGYGVEFLKSAFAQQFTRVAAYAILVLALANVRAISVMTGYNAVLSGSLGRVYCTLLYCQPKRVVADAATAVTLTINAHGYSSDRAAIQAGKVITLTLVNNDSYNCAQAFTIPALGIRELVPVGQTKTITFTAPGNTDRLTYTCSMGMYSGKWDIVH